MKAEQFMPAQKDLARLGVVDFRDRIRGDMIPLSNKFSYFVAALPLQEDDIRDYLADPVAALPPKLVEQIPEVLVLLVPFLERGNGKDRTNGTSEDVVCFDRPNESRVIRSSLWLEESSVLVAVGSQEIEAADFHYELYHQLAWLAGQLMQPDVTADYHALLREELSLHVHGEVDEASWQQKQALLRRQSNIKKDTKAFRDYALRSFVDTLTLYLHGICCDIDVEPGPRQLPSRYLRRRLKLLAAAFAPPEGYAVFPEDQDRES